MLIVMNMIRYTNKQLNVLASLTVPWKEILDYSQNMDTWNYSDKITELIAHFNVNKGGIKDVNIYIIPLRF